MDKYIDVANKQLNFPSRDVAESEKDEEAYSLQYSQAIYNRYLNDRGGLLYSHRDQIDMVRRFGKGNQPTSRYKSYGSDLNVEDGSTSISQNNVNKSREGIENISMRVVSPIPRIKTIIKGYLDQVGQDVFVDAVDPLSNDMKENMKWRMYTIAQQHEFVTEYHLKAGIPVEELEFLPASMTELNLYEAMGGFKLNYARAMEKLIKHTEEISELEDFLKDAWIDDAADLGHIAARVVYDHKIQKYVYRYMDPAYFVIQFVKNDEYDRSEWAGYVEKYTISELKQIMPDKSEDFFKTVAFQNKDRMGNRARHQDTEQWDNFSKRNRIDSSYNYDDFVVEVLETEWIDYEAARHLIYDSVHGRKSVLPLGKDSEIDELGDKQIKRGAKQEDLRTKKRKLRGCKWVIGTNVIFDDGLVNMQDRPNKTEVSHSFRLYTLRDLPLTEQLIPIADDMAIAWYRWQDDRATLQRAGYSIDVSMMENISNGGEDYSFVDVFKAWRESRFLFHQQSLSGKYEGGTTTPIQPIPSMVLEAFQEFHATWEGALKRIEDLTGLNLIMLGATASPNAPVRTTEMSAASAVHVLKPIIKVIGRMKNNLAETAMRRLQLAFKVRPDMVEAYAMVVGNGDVELLKQAEKDAVQYGLTFDDRPSQEAKQNINEAAAASLNARRDGKPGIDLSQYIYIQQQLESGGNLKELAALLDFLMMKSEQAIQQKQEQNIQQQNQGLAQIEQQKAQAAQQLAAQEHGYEMQKIDREGQWDIVKTGQYPSPDQPVAGGQAGGQGGGQAQPPTEAPQPVENGLSPQSGTMGPPA